MPIQLFLISKHDAKVIPFITPSVSTLLNQGWIRPLLFSRTAPNDFDVSSMLQAAGQLRLHSWSHRIMESYEAIGSWKNPTRITESNLGKLDLYITRNLSSFGADPVLNVRQGRLRGSPMR